jgi:hypothetical protein
LNILSTLIELYASSQWKQATKKITAASTFRAVVKVLELWDLKHHHIFLEGITQTNLYIKFYNNVRTNTGFKYYIIPKPGHQIDSNINQHSSPSPADITMIDENPIAQEQLHGAQLHQILDNTTMHIDQMDNILKDDNEGDTVTTTASAKVVELKYNVCYGNSNEIHKLFKLISPYIIQFMDLHPMHDHTIQWKRWINTALTIEYNLSQVKSIFNVNTFEQFFIILHDSPALTPYVDLQWDQP